jgi:hypothetical protein
VHSIVVVSRLPLEGERALRTRIPLGFRSSDSLRTLLDIGKESRPSRGTRHSSYTCLTAVRDGKLEIKRIRKLTRACKSACRTLRQVSTSFAFNTARTGALESWRVLHVNLKRISVETVTYSITRHSTGLFQIWTCHFMICSSTWTFRDSGSKEFLTSN